jgi:hypothetical protein
MMNLFTALSIVSTNDVILSAKHWKLPTTSPSSTTIVFIHQYAKMGGCGMLMEGMAVKSLKQGYQAITFDMRGAGRSTGYCTYTNYDELNDVKAVIDYVSKNLDTDIILVGSSGGAPLAGAALDYSPRIKGGVFIGYGEFYFIFVRPCISNH